MGAGTGDIIIQDHLSISFASLAPPCFSDAHAQTNTLCVMVVSARSYQHVHGVTSQDFCSLFVILQVGRVRIRSTANNFTNTYIQTCVLCLVCRTLTTPEKSNALAYSRGATLGARIRST
mmetsp:Transcript_8727/g.23561  ORF Transcript_8727/g.23561 Transcript_8727/m.23561 type:complete len:120 (-) Transcript_8727:1621-1980(-)